MDKQDRDSARSHLGYGSSYRRGKGLDTGNGSEIKAIMGNQVWMVRPDVDARVENLCVWMEAGVAKFKNCTNFYDCNTCRYDLGMRKQVERGVQISWQEAMRKRSGLDRVCRHSLTDRIDKRACAYNYECSRCDFDQFFEDVWSIKSSGGPREIEEVKGFQVPRGHYFHRGHTWARIEGGGYVRVGLDDFSLKLFGKADALDLPLMGKELDHNEVGWGLKRRENYADILSPVDGVIVEVNSKTRLEPGAANREPYGEGWLFMVRTPDVKAAAKRLMADDESVKWIDSEIEILENMIEETAGPLAADGGLLGSDIFGNLPSLGWKNLTKKFLKTE